jgi:AcrR family transcriptional regulator
MTEQVPHLLRSDAKDNREKVLEAARSLFSERGLDVPTREVARRAEVGPATLYRRFPTKQALIDEAFAGELKACRGIVESGCADPDPWRGFCTVVERLFALNVRNQGFVDAFMSANPEAAMFSRHRVELLKLLAGLARRAREDGRLRHDFVIDDLVLVLLAARGLSSTLLAAPEAAAQRFAAITIDAFRESDTNSPLPEKSRSRRS